MSARSLGELVHGRVLARGPLDLRDDALLVLAVDRRQDHLEQVGAAHALVVLEALGDLGLRVARDHFRLYVQCATGPVALSFTLSFTHFLMGGPCTHFLSLHSQPWQHPLEVSVVEAHSSPQSPHSV